jgi:Domain of unknown function (DUF4436)
LTVKRLAPTVTLAVLAVMLWLGAGSVTGRDPSYRAGERSDPDRVDIVASVQRVDASGRELILRVLVEPRGAVGEGDGLSPSADLTIETSSSVKGDLAFPAAQRIASVDVPVALSEGSITDYPFDRYHAAMEFSARQRGERVPVRMVLTNHDTLFNLDAEAQGAEGVARFELNPVRSGSVLIFALFMMGAMWALAVSVLIGARFLVRRRRGLVWPALGWMAATLFALTAFRNAAPGSPPIGALIDHLAFFWAEVTVAICLVVTVVSGVRSEPPEPPRTAVPEAPA